jgi:hypothetical protein
MGQLAATGRINCNAVPAKKRLFSTSILVMPGVQEYADRFTITTVVPETVTEVRLVDV